MRRWTQKSCRSRFNEAVAYSFNRITVDGDMSTNDTVLVLANGLAGNRTIREVRSRHSKIFKRR